MFTRLCVVFALGALLLPPAADAHIKSSVVATDYRTRLFALPAAVPSVMSARILASDRAIRITVAPGHTAVVFGYAHEPFVRVTTAGVEVNASAPTSGSSGLLNGVRPRAAGWQALSKGRSVTWHDNRVRGLPPGIERGAWSIPVTVDGKRTRIRGELLRVRAPAWWPWLLVGLPFAVLSALIYLRRRSATRPAAAALGLLAAAAMIASVSGFALDLYASNGKWIELGNELVFVLVAAVVIARGSPGARGVAGGALGFLGLWAGLAKYPVFLHGVVLSIFSPGVARALLAITVWSAAAATFLGLVVFEDLLDSSEDPEGGLV